jgi:hypothetical protein
MSTHTSTSSSPTPPSVDALARQLRALKIVVLVLLLVMGLGTAYYEYQRHLGQPVTILINGVPVATLRNAAEANAQLASAEAASVGSAYAGQTPIRMQKITLQRAPANAALSTDADAEQQIRKHLTLRVHAWAIIVNGKISLGLPTEDAADETLDLVKQHFAQMPPEANFVGDPEIMQAVKIAPKVISLSLARQDAASAAPYFWTPPPAKTYQVQRGDTGYKIALQHHISFTDFLAANAGTDVNHLKPGDLVNVQRMPLMLTVEVKKQVSKDQRILPAGPASQAGLQRVTYVVTYLDGVETARDVTNAAILQKPATALSL